MRIHHVSEGWKELGDKAIDNQYLNSSVGWMKDLLQLSTREKLSHVKQVTSAKGECKCIYKKDITQRQCQKFIHSDPNTADKQR